MVLVRGGSSDSGDIDGRDSDDVTPSPQTLSKTQYWWTGFVPIGVVIVRQISPYPLLVHLAVALLALIQLYVAVFAAIMVYEWPDADAHSLPSGLKNVHAPFNIAMYASAGYTAAAGISLVFEPRRGHRLVLLIELAVAAVVSALLAEMSLDSSAQWAANGALEPVSGEGSAEDFAHAKTSMTIALCISATMVVANLMMLMGTRLTGRAHGHIDTIRRTRQSIADGVNRTRQSIADGVNQAAGNASEYAQRTRASLSAGVSGATDRIRGSAQHVGQSLSSGMAAAARNAREALSPRARIDAPRGIELSEVRG